MRNKKHGLSILDYRRRYCCAQSYKLVAQVLIILFMALLRTHGAMPDADANKIADAIYRVEGPVYPYGILSVKVKNKADARRICINTIQNNHRRWEAHHEVQPDFFNYLGDKYCPGIVDPKGNENWKRNIHRILGEKFVAKINKLK